MSEEPVSVRTDGLHAASEHARSWEQAVERAERGETVAVLAHGRHVADVVPSGEIERLRETIDVLCDNDLLRELHNGLDDLRAGRVVAAADVAADLGRRSPRQ
jgi:antitoxin (DNA-binding transcriptional repressor) of toxin-antitoxin stability system